MLPRRQFLRLAVGTAALPALPRTAGAGVYPNKPVRMVVPFAPGGNTDLIARLMGQWLSERLGQPFIIENRPGAGTNIGTEAVVRAPADGYTLLMVHPPSAINATLYEKLNFNFIRDIAPVAGIIRTPFVMEVNPSFPAKSVPELVAYAKINPDKINMASASGAELECPQTHSLRLSISSTRRSTPASPIPTSQRGLPTWAEQRLPARPPTSESSLLRKRRSGPGW